MRSRLPLIAGALAAVALALPLALSLASPAALCPPGQRAAPPYCGAPCPRFKIVKVKARANGTARITLYVEQPGRITISAKAIRTVRINARRSGRFARTLHLKSKLKRLDRTGGTARAHVLITYISGSCTVRLRRVIRFREKPGPHRK